MWILDDDLSFVRVFLGSLHWVTSPDDPIEDVWWDLLTLYKHFTGTAQSTFRVLLLAISMGRIDVYVCMHVCMHVCCCMYV